MNLAQGRWDDAGDAATSVLHDPRSAHVARSWALATLGLIRARRGDSEVDALLDEAHDLVRRTGELDRIGHVAAVRAEAAWLRGDTGSIDAMTGEALALAIDRRMPWATGDIVILRWWAGIVDNLPPESLAEPYRLTITGDAAAAADRWRALGCPYEAALALAAGGEPDAVRRAIEELQRLGARPATAIISRRLREQGARGVPRGPRPRTREHPAGLTAREVEVLKLLTEGLRNAEIAGVLVVSTKTVDHHVSAILRKLGVRTRGEAVAAAARRGLLSPAGLNGRVAASGRCGPGAQRARSVGGDTCIRCGAMSEPALPDQPTVPAGPSTAAGAAAAPGPDAERPRSLPELRAAPGSSRLLRALGGPASSSASSASATCSRRSSSDAGSRPGERAQFLEPRGGTRPECVRGDRRRARADLAPPRAGPRIIVHGDYDVDGVCATAIMVRALRALGGDVGWFLPSRIDDGYGLSAATVERLAARGTRPADHRRLRDHRGRRGRAAARAAGIDVVVTDHHAPARRRRAAGRARSCTRRSAAIPAPSCAGRASRSSSRRRSGRRPPARTSSSSRSRRSPISCRCGARTAGSCATAWQRSRTPPSRACAR